MEVGTHHSLLVHAKEVKSIIIGLEEESSCQAIRRLFERKVAKLEKKYNKKCG